MHRRGRTIAVGGPSEVVRERAQGVWFRTGKLADFNIVYLHIVYLMGPTDLVGASFVCEFPAACGHIPCSANGKGGVQAHMLASNLDKCFALRLQY
jgi:hypothetical protein